MSWLIKKGCQILCQWIQKMILLFFALSLVSCGMGRPKVKNSDSTSEQNNLTSEQNSPTPEQKESTPSENSANNQQEADDKTQLPNPSDAKCLNDGYELRSIEGDVHGIPMSIGSMCYNSETGKQCEAWSYYRGECSLT